jgi:hypothetical protein
MVIIDDRTDLRYKILRVVDEICQKPMGNYDGTYLFLVFEALLLPSNKKVHLTIQNSALDLTAESSREIRISVRKVEEI